MSESATTPAPSPRSILTSSDVVSQPTWPETPVRSAHVVRIGGAGMSAVARLALEAGLTVTGSDSQDGQFIAPLRQAGARIGIGFDPANIGAGTDVVIVSTAVRADNPEIVAARARGLPIVHRAAALAGLLGGAPLLAVAGTHGKTSTTAMAVMALRGAGEDPAWALGAAVPDLGRNAGFGADGTARPPACAVVEADESDGSFLAFAPQVLVLTNQEDDHLDFHGTGENLRAAFVALLEQVRPDGTVVACADDAGAAALADALEARDAAGETRGAARVIRYGRAEGAHWQLEEVLAAPTGTRARLRTPHGPLELSLSVVGEHNVLNAIGALAAASALRPDAALDDLAAGLAPFRGASRRFDLLRIAGGVPVYDDYAHHPREVAATIAAARGIVTDRGEGGRVLVVFQPHLFSRTRDFAEEFARALAAADRAWVLPVYGAREDPDPTVTAATITDRAPQGALLTALAQREDAVGAVADQARPGDLVLMLGAGDIVELTPAVADALEQR